MKRSDYFYSVLLLGNLALIVYGLLNYFWVMAGLLVFSSTFSFVMFLIRTNVKSIAAQTKQEEEPIDFYKTGTRTTYYQGTYNAEELKQVNAAR